MTTILQSIANTLKGLCLDGISAANSGHPGLPLGCAEIMTYLYAKVLRHDPAHPHFMNRDRFVLSAGHGSILLYSVLHLAGFEVSLDQLKRFRQLGSPTAGHPEYSELPGIETTTGPLGQGLATAVGMALGQKWHGARFQFPFSNKVYVLAGDGCMMEGISSEASSLAGHLKLNNLVVIYDSNDICLDGPTSECFSENVKDRYLSYGWDVLTCNGHDFQSLESVFSSLEKTSKPTLIIAKTIIGKGSVVQGSSEAHGKPFSAEDIQQIKQTLHLPIDTPFYVPQEVKNYFHDLRLKQATDYTHWQHQFELWETSSPELASTLHHCHAFDLNPDVKTSLKELSITPSLATRASSQVVLQTLHDLVPHLVGGSADLSCSDLTFMKKGGIFSSENFSGRNIKYGVREFAMGAIASGLALTGIKPYCGTFLTFSDYMRNAIRLAALMSLPVVYQFTHDSIFLGEDGPTHQPIEHLASLRAIPNLMVIRPADATEVKAAWAIALKQKKPVALILSRQSSPDLKETQFDHVEKGAYFAVKSTASIPDFCFLATGTELSLAIQAAHLLTANHSRTVNVVSFPSWELFEKQNVSYQKDILKGKTMVAIEAQSSMGWHRYIGRDGLCITIDSFGKSGTAKDLMQHFGFTPNAIVEKCLRSAVDA